MLNNFNQICDPFKTQNFYYDSWIFIVFFQKMNMLNLTTKFRSPKKWDNGIVNVVQKSEHSFGSDNFMVKFFLDN